MSEEKRPGPGETGGTEGFRFNQITEEPTRQVLVPRADPAARRRAALILVLAVVAVLVLVFLTINPFGVETQGGANNRSFRPDVREPDAGSSTRP